MAKCTECGTYEVKVPCEEEINKIICLAEWLNTNQAEQDISCISWDTANSRWIIVYR